MPHNAALKQMFPPATRVDARSFPTNPNEPRGSLPSLLSIAKTAAEIAPGTGEALSAKRAVDEARAGNLGSAAIDAVLSIPVLGTVGRAVKKGGRVFFHGTPEVARAKSILDKGFTRGASAELGVPGTSLSTNPMVSAVKFAGNADLGTLLKTQIPKGTPIKNLDPASYKTGIFRDGSTLEQVKRGNAVVSVPQSFFNEAEVFIPKGLRTILKPSKVGENSSVANHIAKVREVRGDFLAATFIPRQAAQLRKLANLDRGTVVNDIVDHSPGVGRVLITLPGFLRDSGQAAKGERLAAKVKDVQRLRERFNTASASLPTVSEVKNAVDFVSRSGTAPEELGVLRRAHDPKLREEFNKAHNKFRAAVNSLVDELQTLPFTKGNRAKRLLDTNAAFGRPRFDARKVRTLRGILFKELL